MEVADTTYLHALYVFEVCGFCTMAECHLAFSFFIHMFLICAYIMSPVLFTNLSENAM